MIAIVLLAGLVGALVTFRWKSRRLGKSAWWLALTIVPPLIAYLWGCAFDYGENFRPRPPAWHEQALLVPIALSLLLVAILPLLVREARAFAASIGVLMLGVTLSAALLADLRVMPLF